MIKTLIAGLTSSKPRLDECDECGAFTYPGAKRCGRCVEE